MFNRPTNSCTFYLYLLAIILTSINVSAQQNRDSSQKNFLSKPAVDDYWHYHDVGNIGMTVTNYGLLGQGYSAALQDQPSCQYKYHSGREKEQIEHFSYAGLWFGGIGGINGEEEVLVSTAIVDGVFEYGEAGFEFTNSADESDVVVERSSIVTSPLLILPQFLIRILSQILQTVTLLYPERILNSLIIFP